MRPIVFVLISLITIGGCKEEAGDSKDGGSRTSNDGGTLNGGISDGSSSGDSSTGGPISSDSSTGNPSSQDASSGDSQPADAFDSGSSEDAFDSGSSTVVPGDASSGDSTTGDAAPALRESPWGIASSHAGSFLNNVNIWSPMMRDAGITWVRGFDQTGHSALDAHIGYGHQVAGILKQGSTFPTDLVTWADYVTSTVTEYLGKIQYWEVWNEPPNFSTSASPTEYGDIVRVAYDAAKAVDPDIQIGLAAKSVHVNFLDQAFATVPGLVDHFDYVTVHPYEVFGKVQNGAEQVYLTVVPAIRRMLQKRNPGRADVPIWITEIGGMTRLQCPGGNQGETRERQATMVVQAYTMGIAQGLTRIHWFEAKDGDFNADCKQLTDDDQVITPECSGIPFGLMNGCTNELRPSYTAMRSLISHLGQIPVYLGWILLNQKHYGFVFDGPFGSTLVTWSRPGINEVIEFGATVELVDPISGSSSDGDSYPLTETPLLAVGIPPTMVDAAIANRNEPFPWGGDYSDAKEVRWTAPDVEEGLHVYGNAPIKDFGGADIGRDCSGSAAQQFVVDRNFLLYDTESIRITVVLRRNDPAESAGFNLKYESTTNTHASIGWNGVPADDQWHTLSWDIADDQFVAYWGYNFMFNSDSTEHSKYSIKSVTVTKL